MPFVRAGAVKKYISDSARLVLHENNLCSYVTITAPLLRTHDMRICVGVARRRLAAANTGASTGPPGSLVIGLLQPIVRAITLREADGHERVICFNGNAMLGGILQYGFLFGIIVCMERYLRGMSDEHYTPYKACRKTDLVYSWFYFCGLQYSLKLFDVKVADPNTPTK